MRKHLFFVLLATASIGLAELKAQNWVNGGNTLSANGTLGTNTSHSLLFETSGVERGRITNGGNWGIGTNSPATKFHVYGYGSFGNMATASNATRALNLVDDNAVMRILRVHASYAPAVELISRQTAGGANVAYWDCYAEPSDASFRIRDRKGGGSGLNRLTIKNGSGSVGIGTTVPAQLLHVAGNGVFTGNVGLGTTNPGSYKVKIVHGTFGVNIENTTTLDDWEFWVNSGGLSLYANSSFRGNFNPTTGAYTSVSDERLKTNIQPMPSILDKVNQLKPMTYQFKNTNKFEVGNITSNIQQVTNTESYGFLAQEVMKVFPHLVTHDVDQERGVDVYSLDYSGFGVIAIKAIQELMKKTDEIEEIKQQNAELLERIGKLEQMLNNLTNGNGQSTNAALSNALLGAVTPNPVKGSALIKYSLPEGTGTAQLLITDALGRTIKIIQLTHSGVVNVSTSTLISGVYNYSLVVDNKTVVTRKMKVIK